MLSALIFVSFSFVAVRGHFLPKITSGKLEKDVPIQSFSSQAIILNFLDENGALCFLVAMSDRPAE